MKKLAIFTAAALSLLNAQAASAQTWTPGAGAAPVWVWQGTVTVQKGGSPAFPCTLTVEIVNPGTGAATVTQQPAITPGNTDGVEFDAGFFACPGIVPVTQPFNVDYNNVGGAESFTIRNVYAFTPTPGDCAGDITAAFNDNNPPTSGDNSLDVNAVIPEVTPGSGNCTIIGNLRLITPAGGVDIT